MEINNLEKDLTEAILKTVIGIRYDIFVPKQEWPVAMFEDHPAEPRVVAWLQAKMENLALDGKPIWPVDDVKLQIVSKRPEDIDIKLNIRRKKVNDRYRVTFKYQNVKQVTNFSENL